MSEVRDCKARRYSDEKHCNRCGYVWDINDPEPPKCKTGFDLFKEQQQKIKSNNEKLSNLRY